MIVLFSTRKHGCIQTGTHFPEEHGLKNGLTEIPS
jgi:hypothetical protein